MPARDRTEFAISCYRNMGRLYSRYAGRPLGRCWMAFIQDKRRVSSLPKLTIFCRILHRMRPHFGPRTAARCLARSPYRAPAGAAPRA
jgi:hypothetical protein